MSKIIEYEYPNE